MMNITKKALIVLFSSFTFFSSHAQEDNQQRFEQDIYDFGTIKEEDEAATYKFTFKNDSEKFLKIKEVKASCGCTVPEWSKDSIGPGNEGYVIAKYNTINRPGAFNKSLTVFFEDGHTEILKIKGDVTPRPRTPADDYPFKLGGLRFKSKHIYIGNIRNNDVIEKEIEVYNDTTFDILFNDARYEMPKHIEIISENKLLKPKQKSTLILVYNAKKKDDLGYVNDHINLATDEEVDPKKQLVVVATIEEYFPPMTAKQLALAPKLVFDKETHSFGNITEGTSVSTVFTFTNIGKEKLIIRKTEANCGCTVSKPKKNILKPGESSTIEVTFNSSGRKGRQQKIISVFSNDPSGAVKQLHITANVK